MNRMFEFKEDILLVMKRIMLSVSERHNIISLYYPRSHYCMFTDADSVAIVLCCVETGNANHKSLRVGHRKSDNWVKEKVSPP